MRFRSLLAVLVVALTGFGLVGCGSSGTNNEFVRFGNADGEPTTGSLVFNFITAQSAFTVDANSANLRFEFFESGNATPVLTVNRPFAQSITIDNVPETVTAVQITGFDAAGFPLYTINQTVSVIAGASVTVGGFTNAIPVVLNRLRLAPGNVFNLDQELTQVDVQVGGTSQVFLFAEFSNGSVVVVSGEGLVYDIAGAQGIASVNSLGTVSGLSAGNVTLIASFRGQTLSRPVSVTSGFAQSLSAVSIANAATPLVVTTAAPVQVVTTGTRASDNQSFGLSPSSLSYTIDNPVFAVSGSGVVTVSTGVAVGTNALLTVIWTNPNNSIITTTRTVTVGP